MSKTIFITGASSGLGKETAKLFATKGWNVLATMRKPENETELTKLNNVSVIELNVTNPLQIIQTVRTITEKYDVDVVFNNAGYGLSGPLEAYTDEQITRQINTNLLGVIRVTKEFIPFFKKKGNGILITTTSLAGIVGLPLNSVYNATKWALEGFNESLHYELAPYGIKVKTLAPGAIMTDFVKRSLDSVSLPEYEKMGKDFVALLVGDGSKISTPQQVAKEVYETVIDNKDQILYMAGQDAKEWYENRMEKGKEGFRIEMYNKIYSNK